MFVVRRCSTSTPSAVTRSITSSASCLKRSGRRKARSHAEMPLMPLNEADRAKVASTPHDVRLRRASRKISDIKMTDGLTLVERLAYEKARERGFTQTMESPTPKTNSRDMDRLEVMGQMQPADWKERTLKRRTRLRGIRPKDPADASKSTSSKDVEYEIVGRRVYLPNIIFRLLPNNTPAGQPYNPWEATFYIPHGLTKLDVRNYLHAVYGLKVTYIRTENHYAPIKMRHAQRTRRWSTGMTPKARKRAVVGLTTPFEFPRMREDMTTVERDTDTARLDNLVNWTQSLEERVRRIRRESHLDTDGWTNRAQGMKKIRKAQAAQRDMAETAVSKAVGTMIRNAVRDKTVEKTVIHPRQIPLPKE